MADELDYEVDAADVDMDVPAVAATVAGRRPRNTSDAVQARGRGHRPTKVGNERGVAGRAGEYDRLDSGGKPGGAVKSVEGYIIFVSGLHQEAAHDDVLDAFGEYGAVKNIQVGVEKRSGYVAGYAVIEYALEAEAADAIAQLNGAKLLGEELSVDWAFVHPANKRAAAGGGSGGRSGNAGNTRRRR